jgi:hypothetical protein
MGHLRLVEYDLLSECAIDFSLSYDARAHLDTTTKVGRRCCAAQTSTRTREAMFWHDSASIAALAGGEFGAERQLCPTFVGGGVKMRT